MWKYIRLMRIQDQYVELTSVLAAGILFQIHDARLLLWAFATVLLSIPTYIVNELVDRKDTDKHSWNYNHVKKTDRFDSNIVISLCIICTAIGLGLSWYTGALWWGIAFWVLGMLYSVEPIRFKRRVVIDLLSQPFIWWSIPFLAVARMSTSSVYEQAYLLVTTAIITAVLFPYQIADYFADKKAGHASTHVVLGVYQSLRVGTVIGVVGLLFFFLFNMHRWAVWLLPFVVMMCVILALYARWFALTSDEAITRDIQIWVRRIKPLTQMLVFYFFLVWWFR